MATDLVPYRTAEVVVHQQSAADFMPVMDIQQAVARRDALVSFTKQIMKEGLDYGTIPGSAKPCLLKAGAEKLCTFFGLVGKFEAVEVIEDWTGAQHGGEPLFYYRYRCTLTRNGQVIGEGEGSCSSWESKYRYRWVDESYVAMNDMDRTKLLKRGGRASEFDFAIDRAETTGKYGKPAEYWQRYKDAIANGTATKIERKMKDKKSPAWEIDSTQFRVPNPDVCDVVNTCQKMGQKRALIAATLIGVNASEYFTQDLEDKLERDAPGPGEFGGHDEPPPFHDDEAPRQQRTTAQAMTTPAPAPAPQQPPTKAADPKWDWRSAQAGFAELREAFGNIRYAELLWKFTSDADDKNGAKEVSDLRDAKEAADVYKKLLAQLPADKQTALKARAAQARASSNPTAKPEPIPAALQAIFDQINTGIGGQCQAFEQLKKDLFETFPAEEAEALYYAVLKRQGVEHANKFKSQNAARIAAAELFAAIANDTKGTAAA